MTIREVATQPYPDQRAGTAGLRKRVSVFRQPNYLENYLQAAFDCLPDWRGKAIVIGGDGRYHNRDAILTALGIAAANGVVRVLVGQRGWLSTPAASHLIRASGAAGGLVFTASHNPAGPKGDFGVKLYGSTGGQASEGLMERVFRQSTHIVRYRIADGLGIDLDRLGTQRAGGLEVEVVDPTDAYSQLMQKLFDFDRMRAWLKGHRVVFDAMHAITGPYARRILVDMLGTPPECVLNGDPKEDFGGGKPDPNQVHARHLVDLAHSGNAPDLAAASDGDGDRNFILGRGVFVTPSDSLAVLAANLRELPGYRDGLKGVARSMPTSRALDKVAHENYIDCYETPTGWKFFANLLDAGKVTLCGEESFGTSSSHCREKDGLWAVLAWINLLALTGLPAGEIVERHWQRYGRHYYLRHDYEGLPAPDAMNVMQELGGEIEGLTGQAFGDWKVTRADEFEYHDPVDGSLALSQGLRVVFGDLARIVVRVSGTGTADATVRVYLERYEHSSGTLNWDPAEALAPLVNVAEKIVKIGALTGRNGPTLVT